MNDELIKRIDEQMKAIKPYDKNGYRSVDFDIHALLYDCRAEIKRLTKELKESQALCLKFAQDRETQDAENESLRNQNTALDEKLAEYSERKYVPMTKREAINLLGRCEHETEEQVFLTVSEVEEEVIRRAGLEASND